jgi:hypothetical protein
MRRSSCAWSLVNETPDIKAHLQTLAERLQVSGAHGSSEADTTSVATIKSVSQVMLWSVFGKAERPISAPDKPATKLKLVAEVL